MASAGIESTATALRTANTGASRNTARWENTKPTAPAARAMATLPAWSKAELRPIRRASF
jgi:hypothetical protein